jgi:hypothetical protein
MQKFAGTTVILVLLSRMSWAIRLLAVFGNMVRAPHQMKSSDTYSLRSGLNGHVHPHPQKRTQMERTHSEAQAQPWDTPVAPVHR